MSWLKIIQVTEMHILQEVLDIKVGSSNEWRLCVCNFIPCCMFIQQPSRSAILLPLSQQVIIQLNQPFLSATGSHLFVDTWVCTEFIRLLKFGLWSTHWEKRLWDEGLDIQILHLIDWVTVVHHCLVCTTVWYISFSGFWNSFFFWNSVNPYQSWLFFGLSLWRTTWFLWSLTRQRKGLHLVLFPFYSSRNRWHGLREVVAI